MKTKSKSLENCEVKLDVELDAEEMRGIVKDVEKVFLREAVVPGFRKGKAPIDLVRRDFSDGIKKEVVRQMFQKNYAAAVKAENLDEIAVSEVGDVKYDDNGGSFTAVVEVKPNFKIPTYKGLKIEFKDAKVPESEVTEQVERLRAGYAKYEDAKPGDAAAEYDFAQIDFEGEVNGKKILEINPEAKLFGKGDGFWLRMEDGFFIPEIIAAVKGMKAGETRAGIKVKLDGEGVPEGLKGETAEYTVTLKFIRHRILPSDDEFAEKAKEESYGKLVSKIRETMEKSAVARESQRRENEAVDLLMKKVDFAVPPSMVHRVMDGILQDFAQRAQYSGLDASYFDKNREQILKDAEAQAVRQVRLWYVLDEIAKAEKIEAGEKERGRKVIEFILANAKK
ncbi:MAG: trigger factor [Kiritimatiellae bacterium]|nr:trigger factor [Kiritimatiellia bacterium]